MLKARRIAALNSRREFPLLALRQIGPFDNLGRRIFPLFRMRSIGRAKNMVFADNRKLMSQNWSSASAATKSLPEVK